MIYTCRKLMIIFALVNFYSVFSFAKIAEVFPPEFHANYSLGSNGDIQDKTGKTVEDSPQQRSKSFFLEWSVTSLPCAQNKSFKCIGLYKNQDSEAEGYGSYANPFFASFSSQAEFVMLKMNPTNAEQNSVFKCNGKFVDKLLLNKTSLGDCVEYSKPACQKWSEYINKNSAQFKKLASKKAQCEDELKSIDQMNIEMRNTFQSEIGQAEKNLTASFKTAVSPDQIIPKPSTSEITQADLSSSFLAYTDIFTRTKDCQKFSDFFVKNYSGTSSKRNVSSEASSNTKSNPAKSVKQQQ